jgi:hypothetical protein
MLSKHNTKSTSNIPKIQSLFNIPQSHNLTQNARSNNSDHSQEPPSVFSLINKPRQRKGTMGGVTKDSSNDEDDFNSPVR